MGNQSTRKRFDDPYGRHALIIEEQNGSRRPLDGHIDVAHLFKNAPFHGTRLPVDYVGRHVQ